MAHNIMSGKDPIIYGSGDQRRDFTYVSDVVEATLLAAEAEDLGGEVFNIGFGKDYSINELFKILLDNISFKAGDIKPKYIESYRGDFERTLADNSKARRTLGWKPKVDLNEGIEKFIEWFDFRLRNKGEVSEV